MKEELKDELKALLNEAIEAVEAGDEEAAKAKIAKADEIANNDKGDEVKDDDEEKPTIGGGGIGFPNEK